MLMADTFAIFFAVLGAVLGHVGLWLLSRGLFPRATKAAAEVTERGVVLPLLAGIPTVLGTIVVAIVASSIFGGVGKALAVVVIATWVFYANVGVAGLVEIVGGRLARRDGAERERGPFGDVVRGGAALSFAWMLPLLGWFGLLPLSLLVGAGAVTIGGVRRLLALETRAQPAATKLDVTAPVSTWR